MTLAEKLEFQNIHKDKVCVFKEGVFYKVYNEGVFLLQKLNYKTTVKQYQKTKEKYVSIGFPESVLEKLKLQYKTVGNENTNNLMLYYGSIFDESDFKNWKNKMLLTENASSKSDILIEIKNYPLASKTPIEVFMWVAAMQQKLKDQ